MPQSTPPWPYNNDNPVRAVHRAVDPDCPSWAASTCPEYKRIQNFVDHYETWRSYHPEARPVQQLSLHVSTVHPVEEIAVHPDSLDDLKTQMRLLGAEKRLGGPIDAIYGFPITLDPSLDTGHVRMRPRGYDAHPHAPFQRKEPSS
ncbi:hypothetical protein [Streptomyces sp. cg35]|uniref:hypothetical protein n=1 Tax=Streptomyces sp. cg35 TaxID=3421650 RepID=UPI003D173690